MTNIGLIIQARMGSTRLPGKVLMEIGRKTVLLHILERVRKLKKEYKIIIAIPLSQENDKIEEFCKKEQVLCFRGSENDVLDRYYQAAKLFKLDHIVRLTGDNPFVDVDNLEFLISEHLKNNADYSSNKSEVNSGLPDGIGSEIFKFSALEKSWLEGKKDHHREHVDEYILENPKDFKFLVVKAKNINPSQFKDLRLTIDTKEDLEFIRKIYGHLYRSQKVFSVKEIINLLNNHSELIKLNIDN